MPRIRLESMTSAADDFFFAVFVKVFVFQLFETASEIETTAASISSSVVIRPVDSLSVPAAYSSGTPIAASTCEITTLSEWQAAPAEQATSCSSARIS